MHAALEPLQFVRNVEVDYANKTARITVDPESYTPGAVVDALKSAGFGAEVRGGG